MRRKIFITLCSVLSAVFLISYLLIFFLFRSVLFQEIRQQQVNLQKYNETIFTSYIDSFSMVPFQLVNDEEIGELANTDSDSYLDMFRARELLRKKFNKYLNQQLFSSNLDCRILFYLNDNIPLASYCDAYTLSEHVALRTCQVYSSRLVKDQEWYTRAKKITWSPYFFINEDTDELCYSKYVYNYALNSSSEGIGTVVIAIPENAFLEKLSTDSITPNSRFFLSNEYQELLYSSGEVSDNLFFSALSKSSGQILRDSTSHERYLVSTSSVNQDLFLTFLTPLSDIEQIVITALFPYILFVLIAFFPTDLCFVSAFPQNHRADNFPGGSDRHHRGYQNLSDTTVFGLSRRGASSSLSQFYSADSTGKSADGSDYRRKQAKTYRHAPRSAGSDQPAFSL